MPAPHQTARTEATLGLGAGAGLTADLPLTLPTGHPSSHGLLHVRVGLDTDDPCDDDARIVWAQPRVGFLHRGAEKLFEVRDYRQILALADRHDWLGAFAGELPIALAVEHLTGMAVPERATWIRTLIVELTRIASHLAFLAAFPAPGAHDARGGAVATATNARQALLALLELGTGSRIHPMYAAIGGVRADLPDGWTRAAHAALDGVAAALPALREHLLGAGRAEAHTGLGLVRPETVLSHGVSGAVARASGLDVDLRRDSVLLAYPALFAAGGPGRVVTRPGADVHARLEVVLEQVDVALDLCRACLARLDSADLTGAEVNVRLPKVLRAPEGVVYAALESPLGAAGVHLVSRGDKLPWRLRLRTPSYAVVSALSEILPGVGVGDAATVLASLFFVMGDVDK